MLSVPNVFAEAPRFIPRRFMPQIEESSTTALVEWLGFRGITVESVTVEATRLHYRQTVGKLHAIPEDVLAKPVWLSADNVVLDGNHRAAMLHKLNRPVSALRLSVAFLDAIEALFSFAGTTLIQNRGD